MRSQRLHPVALGGVMSCRQIGNPALSREMYGLFGYLAGHKGINAQGDRLLEIPLGAAGTPGDSPNRPGAITDHHRRPPEDKRNLCRQRSQVTGLDDRPQPGDILFAETPVGQPAKQTRQLRVVA